VKKKVKKNDREVKKKEEEKKVKKDEKEKEKRDKREKKEKEVERSRAVKEKKKMEREQEKQERKELRAKQKAEKKREEEEKKGCKWDHGEKADLLTVAKAHYGVDKAKRKSANALAEAIMADAHQQQLLLRRTSATGFSKMLKKTRVIWRDLWEYYLSKMAEAGKSRPMPKRSGGSDSDGCYDDLLEQYNHQKGEILNEALDKFVGGPPQHWEVWTSFFMRSSIAGPLEGDDFEERKANQEKLIAAKKAAKAKKKAQKQKKETDGVEAEEISLLRLISSSFSPPPVAAHVAMAPMPVGPRPRWVDTATQQNGISLDTFLQSAFPSPLARDAVAAALRENFVVDVQGIGILSDSDIDQLHPAVGLRSQLKHARSWIKWKPALFSPVPFPVAAAVVPSVMGCETCGSEVCSCFKDALQVGDKEPQRQEVEQAWGAEWDNFEQDDFVMNEKPDSGEESGGGDMDEEPGGGDSGEELQEWACISCTYVNPPRAPVCAICEGPAPQGGVPVMQLSSDEGAQPPRPPVISTVCSSSGSESESSRERVVLKACNFSTSEEEASEEEEVLDDALSY
jgi:hypothetical protein